MTYRSIRKWQLAHPEKVREYQRRYRLNHQPKPRGPEYWKAYSPTYIDRLISRYNSGETLSLSIMLKIKSRLTGTYKPHKPKARSLP